MFNSIFKENVQRWKHSDSCAFAKLELLGYKKPERVVQNEKNGHKDPNDNHNNHDGNHDEIELYQGNSKRSTYWHVAPEKRIPQNSPTDCDGVQLTTAQCHMVPISNYITENL